MPTLDRAPSAPWRTESMKLLIKHIRPAEYDRAILLWTQPHAVAFVVRPLAQVVRRRMLEDQGELMTVQAAADRLAVSRWMIYRLIWDRQVKSVQIGRCRRIVRKSLDDYIAGLIDGAA